jgi:hypothetical protein
MLGDARPRVHPGHEGTVVGAWENAAVVALARIENGFLRPVRVFNR